MNYIIITGASKGLGYSIATGLLNKNNHLFCISRTKNLDLIKAAQSNNCRLDYFEYDLSDISGLDALMQRIFTSITVKESDEIFLVNNAGTVTPVKPVDKCTGVEIAKNVTVNTVSPMVLTSLFSKHTKDFKIEKRVINISSGAGKKPYYWLGRLLRVQSGYRHLYPVRQLGATAPPISGKNHIICAGNSGHRYAAGASFIKQGRF